MAGVYREIYYHVAKITRSLGKDLASMNHVKQNMQQLKTKTLHQWVSQGCIGCRKLWDCRNLIFCENYWVMMNNSKLLMVDIFRKDVTVVIFLLLRAIIPYKLFIYNLFSSHSPRQSSSQGNANRSCLAITQKFRFSTILLILDKFPFIVYTASLSLI